MQSSWIINGSAAGQRLDVFLAEKLPDMTRSAIAKQLKAGAGQVNGKPASVHEFLKADDKVEFKPAKSGHQMSARRTGDDETRLAKIDIRKLIVKETPDWIVINKPAGLLVHPDAKHPDGTLVDSLVDHYPPLAKVGEDPARPGIVHRLDKDVSGLMVVAKTQQAFDDLKQQFAQRQTRKTYWALVHGHPPELEGEIRFRIARSKSQARMAARPEKDEGGKAAWSHYRVIDQTKKLSLLEVQIMSGRTHQIRAHLLALGCPIVGDQLYRRKDAGRSGRKGPEGTDRLMLQSVQLAFADPRTGEPESFALKPDPAFLAALKTA